MKKATPAKSTGKPPGGNQKFVITSGPGLEPIQKVIANAESYGGDPNIYNYGQFFKRGDPNNCLKAATITPVTPNGTTKFYNAKALDLSNSTIRQVLQAMRKYNGVGANRKEVNPLGVDNDCPATGVYNKALFASGLYQFIPETLYSNVNAISKTDPTIWDWKFNAENQTKLANSVFFLDGQLGEYLSGKNSGNKADLEKAINEVAGIWASMPTAGDIDVGTNTVGKYATQGGNHEAKEVGQALITSRIQYCATENPTAVAPYKPTWYVQP
jgi:hypothetical protein